MQSSPSVSFENGNVDAAVGIFTPDDGSGEVAFGPGTIPEVLLSQLLADERPGSYRITDGVETGQIGNISFANFEDINFDVMCFARGTRILTQYGYKPVETIKPGARVWTLDNGYQPVIWHGVSRMYAAGNVAPVLFEPGIFGNTRPLVVSPQHRILLSDPEVQMLTGDPEAFAAAKMLVDGRTVHELRGGIVEYHHILLEHHNVLLSENVLTESYFPGGASWDVLSIDDRKLIGELIPRIQKFGPSSYGQTCRLCLKHFEAVVVRDRLMQNRGCDQRCVPAINIGRSSHVPVLTARQDRSLKTETVPLFLIR